MRSASTKKQLPVAGTGGEQPELWDSPQPNEAPAHPSERPPSPETKEPEGLVKPTAALDQGSEQKQLPALPAECPVGEGADRETAPLPTRLDEPMPSRMLNEFIYCPRLFYYMYVEGIFVENADTERGSALHVKVDKGRGDLPAASKSKSGKKAAAGESTGLSLATAATHLAGAIGDDQNAVAENDRNRPDVGPEQAEASTAMTEDGAGPEPGPEAENPTEKEKEKETETEAPAAGSAGAPTGSIHSRSAMLSSTRLQVVAKLDLIEAKVSLTGGVHAEREVLSVVPVDYKAGAPREGRNQTSCGTRIKCSWACKS